MHSNSATDTGYLQYLGSVADELTALTLQQPRILDFGSGKEAVLTKLLRHSGFDCTAYDPLYGIGCNSLMQQYDLIVLCEVIEHIVELASTLHMIRKCCVPGGYVVIKTQPAPESVPAFFSWWYTHDPTHINFFTRRSLIVLSQVLDCIMEHHESATLFFFKKNFGC